MRLSYSSVSTFMQCPYRFMLRYVKKLPVQPDLKADNALYLGTGLHKGLETGDIRAGVEEYYSQYPVITDDIVTEGLKLEKAITCALPYVPDGSRFETKLESEEFVGYIDCLTPTGVAGEYDMLDFKYTANGSRYEESAQLHVYRHYAEALLGVSIRRMAYLIVPKLKVKGDSLVDTRRAVRETEQESPYLIAVDYDRAKVAEFKEWMERAKCATSYEKMQGNLCRWCEYYLYCLKGKEEEILRLPVNEKVRAGSDTRLRLWIYGLPFVGKTYLANQFPDVLFLNTDGNVKEVDSQRLYIRDTFTEAGRRILAWNLFKETLDELEKGNTGYKTIVVDLLEDMYEYCRKWGYDKLHIEHESDDSFRAWDVIRTEFLFQIRRLLNMDYDVILISHEDTSRDITSKGGDKVTAIRPNIGEKIALKVAGMVDLTFRITRDGDDRRISFKTSSVIFGGGRIQIDNNRDIPCSYESLCKALGIDGEAKVEAVASKPEPVATPEPMKKDESDEFEVKEEPPASRPRPRRRID